MGVFIFSLYSRMSLNNTLTNEDVMGLYPVNTNKLVNNVKKYGTGNRNVSPNITSPRLNNLPAIGNMPNENVYNVPRPVPKMRLLPPPVKKNNVVVPKKVKEKQNRKSRRNRRNHRNTRKN